MARDTKIFNCPCGCQIHINFTTRKITLLEKAGKKVEDLDELVEKQEQDEAAREGMFEQALEQNANEKDRLDALFEDAKKKAAEDKDTGRPANPFDME